MLKRFACGVLLCAAQVACGDLGEAPDAGPAGDGGGGDAMRGGALADLEGSWSFALVQPDGMGVPSLSCTALVGAGGFEVTCPRPGLPLEVEPSCTQMRDDLHFKGTVGAELSGVADTIVQFSGNGCAQHGYTTGAPYPTSPFAVMDADHVVKLPLPMLSPLGGKWIWSFEAAADPDDRIGCSVDIGPSQVELEIGVNALILCPLEAPLSVFEGCDEQQLVELDLELRPGQMEGTLTPLTRHTGAACEGILPPEVRAASATVTATRTPQ